MNTILFFTHIGILTYLGWKTSQYFNGSLIKRFLSTYLFGWANLILCALLLSPTNSLSSPHHYFLYSILIALLAQIAAKKLLYEADALGKAANRKPDTVHDGFHLIKAFMLEYRRNPLFISFILIAAIMLMVAATNYPTTDDSTRIKLPRAFFYVQQGNLLPSELVSAMSTMFIFPFNGILAQIIVVAYKQSAHWLLLFGYLQWWVLAVTAYALSREVGATQNGSLIGVWFLVLCQQLIFAGTSDNDDILSTTPFLVGLFFLLCWLKEPKSRYAALSGLGLGIGLGVKYLQIFLLPGLILVFSYYLLIKWGQQERMSFIRARWKGTLLAIFMALLMVSPELFVNYQVTGNPLVKPKSVAAYHLNTSFPCGIRHIGLNLAELALEPIGQIIGHLPKKVGEEIVHYITQVTQSNNQSGDCLGESFSLGNSLNIDRPSEHTVWYGVAGYLTIFCAIVLLATKSYRFSIAYWLAIIFMTSLVVFPMWTNYWRGIGRYSMSTFMLGAPIIAVCHDYYIRHARRLWRNLLSILSVVTIIFAINGLFFNTYRSVVGGAKTLLGKDYTSRNYTGDLNKVLGAVDKVNIYFNDLFPIYGIMQRHPKIDFSFLKEFVSGRTNIIFLPEQYSRTTNWHDEVYFMPILAPLRRDEGFAFLQKAYSKSVYANNLPVSMVNELSDDRYLLLGVGYSKDVPVVSKAKITLVTPSDISNLEYQVTDMHGGGILGGAEWREWKDYEVDVPSSGIDVAVRVRQKNSTNHNTASCFHIGANNTIRHGNLRQTLDEMKSKMTMECISE